MKLIVISRSRLYKGELDVLIALFKEGLKIFHLRKPQASKGEIENYLKQIPQKYLNRVVLHTRHELAPKYGLRGIHLTRKHRQQKLKTWFLVQSLKVKHPTLTVSTSFHSLETLIKNGANYDYSFLSPIFDSISKERYKANFESHDLSKVLKSLDHKVIALGGINEYKIESVQEMGFSGAALLGSIWRSEDPLKTFVNIQQRCEKSPLVLA